MKVLGVILALAIVTGSQAMVIREAPDSPTKLEELITKLESCLEGISSIPFAIFFWNTDSKTIQTVVDQMAPFMESFYNLTEEIPPEIKEAAEVMFGVPWNLANKAHTTLVEMDGRTHDELQQVIKALGSYLDPVLLRVSSLTDPFLHTYNMWTEEITQGLDARVSQAVEPLDSQLSIYLKSVQEVPEALLPLVVDVGKKVRSGLESLNKNLLPYFKPFLEESRKYREEFKEWMRAPVFPPQRAVISPARKRR